MKPIVWDNFPFPSFFPFDAITLWPFILFRGPRDQYSERLLKHELEHWYQAKRYFVLPFYVLYVGWWVVNMVKYRDAYLAYWRIPFEVSARQAEFYGLSDSERGLFFKKEQ
jgi:hypothetical protein